MITSDVGCRTPLESAVFARVIKDFEPLEILMLAASVMIIVGIAFIF